MLSIDRPLWFVWMFFGASQVFPIFPVLSTDIQCIQTQLWLKMFGKNNFSKIIFGLWPLLPCYPQVVRARLHRQKGPGSPSARPLRRLSGASTRRDWGPRGERRVGQATVCMQVCRCICISYMYIYIHTYSYYNLKWYIYYIYIYNTHLYGLTLVLGKHENEVAGK